MPSAYTFKSTRARVAYHIRQARRRGLLLRYAVLYLTAYLVLALFIPVLGRPLAYIGLPVEVRAKPLTVVGVVTSADEEPIPGVTVFVGGYRATTQADGLYRLEFSAEELNQVPIVFSFGESTAVQRFDASRSRENVLNFRFPS